MQIWRARNDEMIVIKKMSFSDEWMILRVPPTVVHGSDLRIINLDKGKAYSVFDTDPFSGGDFKVNVYYRGRACRLDVDGYEMHRYFVIDKELTEAVNTIKEIE